MCWGSQNICLSAGCLFGIRAWPMLKHSFFPPTVSEKQLGRWGGHLHSNTQRAKFSKFPAGPVSHLQPQHLPCQLRALYVVPGWKHGKSKGSFSPGQCISQGRVQHWVEWTGGQGRSSHGGDRAASKALPRHPAAAHRKHGLVCSPCNPCTQAMPTAPREANSSSKGLQWPPPGCQSPTQPQSPRGFLGVRSAGEQSQGLSTPWREVASETP